MPAILLCIAAMIGAEDSPPAKIGSFLEAAEKARVERIKFLEQRIQEVGRTRIVGQSPAQRRVAVQKARAEFDAAKKSKDLVVPRLDYPPKVGMIGRLSGTTCGVDQVIDEDEMIVTASWAQKTVVVRNNVALPSAKTVQADFWVKGVSTAGLTDDRGAELKDVFEVTGTKQYETVFGSTRTILVLEPFDLQRVEPYRKGGGKTK
jgi:hypothetical protein